MSKNWGGLASDTVSVKCMSWKVSGPFWAGLTACDVLAAIRKWCISVRRSRRRSRWKGSPVSGWFEPASLRLWMQPPLSLLKSAPSRPRPIGADLSLTPAQVVIVAPVRAFHHGAGNCVGCSLWVRRTNSRRGAASRAACATCHQCPEGRHRRLFQGGEGLDQVFQGGVGLDRWYWKGTRSDRWRCDGSVRVRRDPVRPASVQWLRTVHAELCGARHTDVSPPLTASVHSQQHANFTPPWSQIPSQHKFLIIMGPSFLEESPIMYRCCPSVCLSLCLSVCPSVCPVPTSFYVSF